MKLSGKKGFTLVELSIVLVIIGLLIGGILVGQSLVDSARVNKEAQKITQWSVAIIQFKEKFKQDPGDSILFPNPGDNNGNIYDFVGACPANRAYEPYSAWSHLTQAGMLTGERYSWDSVCANQVVYEGMVPKSAFNVYSGNKESISIESQRTQFSYGGKKFTYLFRTVYKFYDTLALVKKLDDGDTANNKGFIRSYTYADVSQCDASGAEVEVQAVGLESTRDVICSAMIFFNGIIVPN